jgi:hypothetical protein
MCRFLSALVFRNGDIYWSPFTDSHDELLAMSGRREYSGDELCRVEFTSKRLDIYSEYVLDVDEAREPEWFAKIREATENKLRAVIAKMIVSDYRPLIIGGEWIATSGADMNQAEFCRIMALAGSRVGASHASRVIARNNSSVYAYAHSYVEAYSGASVEAHIDSYVEAFAGSIVMALLGSTVIARMGSNVTAYEGSRVVGALGANITKYGAADTKNE